MSAQPSAPLAVWPTQFIGTLAVPRISEPCVPVGSGALCASVRDLRAVVAEETLSVRFKR